MCTAPYVKVYLLENGACIAKKKTKVARKTLDPLYQQQLSFEESPGGKVLQVSNIFPPDLSQTNDYIQHYTTNFTQHYATDYTQHCEIDYTKHHIINYTQRNTIQ